MANQRMQKQKLLEILRLLQQEADNEHPLKCSEIIARLSQKGMSAERKSVYSDIDILRQAGWDIRYQKNQGYWLKRRYTLAQLKLLSDAVGSLTILSADQARQFNALLLEECSRYQQPQLSPLPRIPFDLKEYAARSFGMYASEPVNMTLRFDLSLANTVFDRFGQDVMITRITDQDFDVNLTLSAAPPFLGWLFQFGQKVRILQPQSLKDQMREAAEAALRSLDEESAG